MEDSTTKKKLKNTNFKRKKKNVFPLQEKKKTACFN